MATCSSFLAYKIPWMEGPGRLFSPWGRERAGHDLVTKQQKSKDLSHFHWKQIAHEPNFVLFICGCYG